MSPRLSIALLAWLLIAAGCGSDKSDHERALEIWEANLKTAERLAEAEATGEEASPELKRIDDFFRRVTGGSGLLTAHTFDNITVSPQAHAAIRLLREWCDQNCDRLSIDPESGQVVVLPPVEVPPFS